MPHFWVIQGLGHEVGCLLLCVDVAHRDSWVRAHLEEPVQVNTMRPGQMAQGHAPSFLNQLDDGLIVFGNDEVRLLLWLPCRRSIWLDRNFRNTDSAPTSPGRP